MDTLIQLGSFVFSGLEIPEKINFGGAQQLVQHNLIGGNRVIDSLGKNDIDISWSGLMTGSTALTRAQQLNQMRVTGQQLTLNWFNLNYNVVIQNFVANTERYYQVTYDIVLRVISDGNNPVTSQNLVGFNEVINADYNTIAMIGANIATTAASTDKTQVTNLTNTINSLGAQIASVSSFNGADQSLLTPIINAVNSALTAVQSYIVQPAERLFGLNQ